MQNLEQIAYERKGTVFICAPMMLVRGHFPFT